MGSIMCGCQTTTDDIDQLCPIRDHISIIEHRISKLSNKGSIVGGNIQELKGNLVDYI